jgi:hypothetical protein
MMKMMLIERLYTDDKDAVWSGVIGRLKARGTRTVQPLYVSDLEGQEYLSVVFHTDVIDDCARFLVDNVAMCKNVNDTKTIMLLKPAFLPMPGDRPKDLERFSLYLKVQPKYYPSVYNEILHHEFEVNCFPNYVAYAFGDYDILATFLARDKSAVKDYVRRHLEPLSGIEDIHINRIKRTELLATKPSWREIQRSLLYIPPWMSKKMDDHYLYDIDPPTEEYLMLTGAMEDEL